MVEGLWLPLVTPFRDGGLDETSLRRMARHYLGQPVDGFILAATTGEGLTIDEDETERLVSVVATEITGRRPIYLGVSGSDTRKVALTLAQATSPPGWAVAQASSPSRYARSSRSTGCAILIGLPRSLIFRAI